jgi:hypothetical protein
LIGRGGLPGGHAGDGDRLGAIADVDQCHVDGVPFPVPERLAQQVAEPVNADRESAQRSPSAGFGAGIELRGAYDKATAELEERREAGRDRIAALQAEIDAENAELAGAVNDAAVEFNDAAADLVETGFATPKVLSAKGLATIRVKK